MRSITLILLASVIAWNLNIASGEFLAGEICTVVVVSPMSNNVRIFFVFSIFNLFFEIPVNQ